MFTLCPGPILWKHFVQAPEKPLPFIQSETFLAVSAYLYCDLVTFFLSPISCHLLLKDTLSQRNMRYAKSEHINTIFPHPVPIRDTSGICMPRFTLLLSSGDLGIGLV